MGNIRLLITRGVCRMMTRCYKEDRREVRNAARR